MASGGIQMIVTYELFLAGSDQTDLSNRVGEIQVYATCNSRAYRNEVNIQNCKSHVEGDKHFCFALGVSKSSCKESGVINNNHYDVITAELTMLNTCVHETTCLKILLMHCDVLVK